MYSLKRETLRIPAPGREMKCVLLRPKTPDGPVPGILWIHGGGYVLGMAAMADFSVGKRLARQVRGGGAVPGVPPGKGGSLSRGL